MKRQDIFVYNDGADNKRTESEDKTFDTVAAEILGKAKGRPVRG